MIIVNTLLNNEVLNAKGAFFYHTGDVNNLGLLKEGEMVVKASVDKRSRSIS